MAEAAYHRLQSATGQVYTAMNRDKSRSINLNVTQVEVTPNCDTVAGCRLWHLRIASTKDEKVQYNKKNANPDGNVIN